ncbi:hypothetical protein DKY63_18550 [Pseudomonas putida]|uniref:Uncharacterized protein n=1 Tax=Pseudomonas putida TaxID=303 RepID=A0A2Z4RNE5_PSEPU|nr:hypothetical protein DKY63_18550 [Pseudomonas putida]
MRRWFEPKFAVFIRASSRAGSLLQWSGAGRPIVGASLLAIASTQPAEIHCPDRAGNSFKVLRVFAVTSSSFRCAWK